MSERKRPVSPVKPKGLELLFLYACPYCSTDAPALSPTEPCASSKSCPPAARPPSTRITFRAEGENRGGTLCSGKTLRSGEYEKKTFPLSAYEQRVPPPPPLLPKTL